MRFSGKYVKNALKTNFVKDPEGRGIDNLWTGYKAAGPLKLAAFAGLGIYTANEMANAQERIMMDYRVDQRGVQSLPGTRGDQMGYMANSGGMPDLVGDGDLVFALHNLRHGG